MKRRQRPAFSGGLLPVISVLLVLALGCGGRSHDPPDMSLDAAANQDAAGNRDAAADVDASAHRDDAADLDAGSALRDDASLPPGSNDADADDAMSPTRDAETPLMPGADAGSARTLIALAITPSEMTLSQGDFVNLQVMALYSDTSQVDVTALVAFETSDQTVARISNASAWASLVGKATITASLGGQKGSALIIVQKGTGSENVTSIKVAVGPTCANGEIADALAIATLSNGAQRNVTKDAQWASNSASAALVAPYTIGPSPGMIVCLSDGVTVIAATLGAVRGEATLVSHGSATTPVVILGPSLLRPGGQAEYSVAAQLADGSSVLLAAPTFTFVGSRGPQV